MSALNPKPSLQSLDCSSSWARSRTPSLSTVPLAQTSAGFTGLSLLGFTSFRRAVGSPALIPLEFGVYLWATLVTSFFFTLPSICHCKNLNLFCLNIPPSKAVGKANFFYLHDSDLLEELNLLMLCIHLGIITNTDAHVPLSSTCPFQRVPALGSHRTLAGPGSVCPCGLEETICK